MSEIAVSVVVPTYNSRDSLRTLVSRLTAVLAQRREPFEIVIVNDASPDDSFDVLRRLALEFPQLRAIDLQINHGQAAATMCGLAHARGEIVVTMDDDLQQPPEELPKLFAALEQNPDWDAVVGTWPKDQGMLRNFGSWVHALADRMAYKTPRDWHHTTFRAMRRPVVTALIANETRSPVLSPLLRQVSNAVVNVPVEHHERSHGATNFRLIHGMATVRANFFSGSSLPLRILSGFGLLSSALSFLLGLAYFLRWATNTASPPPGYMSTFLAVVFFGGATLLGLGVLGEYTALMMREVRRPPRWIIRREISGLDASSSSDAPTLEAGAVDLADRSAALEEPATTPGSGRPSPRV